MLIDAFCEALLKKGFAGDISSDLATRVVNATDNSVYQVLPASVLAPKNTQDVVRIFQLASEPLFHSLNFTPRGGGTGTNAQALNHGVIIDCSKYLTSIVELNLDEGFVRVEPGVILDELNHFLKPHGVFFAVEISTSNRATLGGMSNTDACGQGSRVYGKTSQHILEMTCVYSDGTLHTSSAIDRAQLLSLQKQSTLLGEIYRQVDETVIAYQDEIKKQFPTLSRFMTGYDLAHVYDDAREHFNLNAILTGSEGTLAVVAELKLKLTPIPLYKKLVVMHYENFSDALNDASFLVSFNPLAIETIDEMVLQLAKTDCIYQEVKKWIEGAGTTRAINLVEFAGDDENFIEAKIAELTKKTVHSFCVVNSLKDIESCWQLRKKSVGLLGKKIGARKPVSGIEDTVVPPQHLARYIKAFRQLLDEAGLEYAMYGHVDVGCVHVRPALDLSDAIDDALYEALSDKVAHLVQRFGGIMWGEHGKGMRSRYVPMFFGQTLTQELEKIKHAFDPHYQLNPGKIVHPVMFQKRAHWDKPIHESLAQTYASAMHCNGNGACFNQDAFAVMCPSYKVTRDRVHSPKGRASLLREWMVLESTKQPELLQGEVFNALQGCLGCKACVTQCPVNVDIPSMKAQFLHTYYQNRRRPWRDYVIALSEALAYRMARFPRLANIFVQNAVSRFFVRYLFKLEDLPKWSVPSLRKRCKQENISFVTALDLRSLKERAQVVVIVQDWLTSNYDAQLVVDYVHVLKALGFQPFVLESIQNGKTWHVRGFLKQFKAISKRTAQILTEIAQLNIPMIGIDPSITLTYRQEYPQVLGAVGFKVELLQEFLREKSPLPSFFKGGDQRQAPHQPRAQPLHQAGVQPLHQPGARSVHSPLWKRGAGGISVPESAVMGLNSLVDYNPPYGTGTVLHLLLHCTEKTANEQFTLAWVEVFAAWGLRLEVKAVGCCGMAGSYGLETEHVALSRQIFNMNWQPHLQKEATCLATGYSCRSQTGRFSEQKITHPATWLRRYLQDSAIIKEDDNK